MVEVIHTYLVKLALDCSIFQYRTRKHVTILGDVFDEFHTPIFVQFLQSIFTQAAE